MKKNCDVDSKMFRRLSPTKMTKVKNAAHFQGKYQGSALIERLTDELEKNNSDPKIIKAILDAKPDFRIRVLRNPVVPAAKKNDNAMVKYLLDRKASPMDISWTGKSPLAYAVMNQNFDLIRMLINAGACPAQQWKGVDTPYLPNLASDAKNKGPFYKAMVKLTDKHREFNCWCKGGRLWGCPVGQNCGSTRSSSSGSAFMARAAAIH